MAHRRPRPVRRLLALFAAPAISAPALVLAADVDPLSLQSAPVQTAAPADAGFKLFAEGALGRIDRRHGLPDQTLRRVSIDYAQTFRLSNAVRLTVSDRLDHVEPVDAGAERTLNSVRELYAGWRDGEGSLLVDLGRVNLRHGPGYGYNPTDFLRDFAVRAATTVDPFALRENRQGTVMARAQKLWGGGSMSVAFAPRIERHRSTDTFSLDLGATNAQHRLLASVSTQHSDRLGTQALLYWEDGKGTQVGASYTALATDALVLHGEWTYGRDLDLLDQARGLVSRKSAHRAVLGGTFTTSSRLSLTGEFEFNGFAAKPAAWEAAATSGTAWLDGYLVLTQARQDNAARQSVVVYATQKDAFKKNLDVTALLRINTRDSSHLGWVELRHHWNKLDGVLQWQWSDGGRNSEHGRPVARQTIQAQVAWYF